MRTPILLTLMILLLGASAAFGQAVGTIDLGGTVQGAVSTDNPAPSYFFETTGPASLLAPTTAAAWKKRVGMPA